MSEGTQQNNSATTGRDSLGKALRRNLSLKRLGGHFSAASATVKARGWQALGRELSFRLRLACHGETWRYRADIPLNKELRAQRANPPVPAPLVSVLCPLYNTPPGYLRQMMDSVLGQSYRNLELVLADASDAAHSHVGEMVRQRAEKDPRIKLVSLKQNEGIAGNTNRAIEASNGTWLCLLDHDDVLQPNALYEVISAANTTGADWIYSDEIVLDDSLKKLGEYHFKGDFGPDTLRGCNYIGHLSAFSRQLLERAGAYEDSAFDGAQDYDLALRLSEHATRIYHLPKVLYFWRRHGGSTASGIGTKPKAEAAGAAALQAHLGRLGLAGQAQAQSDHPGSYRVDYEVAGRPLVSVLIPSCDHVDDLDRCLASLYAKGGWPPLEVLVLDNNSKETETPLYYETAVEKYPGLRVLHYEGVFNYSAINNFGVKQAAGEHLLLLNNDVELLTDGFVRELLSYSQRPDTGAVGAMLYYPDDTVQHGGLIVGLGGTAGVSHKGHPKGDGGDMFRLCTTQNVSAVTGAALMVKAALYRQMGGLDGERFAVAFNDVDFCLRLDEAGYWNVFTPFAAAYHFESKSRGYDVDGPNKQRFDKESAGFKERWAGVLGQGDRFYNPHFTLKFENFGYR